MLQVVTGSGSGDTESKIKSESSFESDQQPTAAGRSLQLSPEDGEYEEEGRETTKRRCIRSRGGLATEKRKIWLRGEGAPHERGERGEGAVALEK